MRDDDVKVPNQVMNPCDSLHQWGYKQVGMERTSTSSQGPMVVERLGTGRRDSETSLYASDRSSNFHPRQSRSLNLVDAIGTDEVVDARPERSDGPNNRKHDQVPTATPSVPRLQSVERNSQLKRHLRVLEEEAVLGQRRLEPHALKESLLFLPIHSRYFHPLPLRHLPTDHTESDGDRDYCEGLHDLVREGVGDDLSVQLLGVDAE